MNNYRIKYLCIKDYTTNNTKPFLLYKKDMVYYVKKYSIENLYLIYNYSDSIHPLKYDLSFIKEYFMPFKKFRDERINSIFED